ncbi:SUKH-4 family immunity protein [Streptomyces sp. NPDC057363]|uniref:SUKH-4 family immunity protein n=1 Tax=Streptomyces sp. NPDC057363 TaxID=3346107 RepID=UPI0036411A07
MRVATSGTTTMVCSAGTAPATAAQTVPSLVTWVRLTTSGQDPSWTRGASRWSRGVCERPSLWRTSALLWCLFLTAGRPTVPGRAPALPARFLDREFGRGGVTRFEDLDFPGTLGHEPTRRFLRETGLPEDAHPFRLDQADLPQALPTVAEWCEEFPEHRLPDRADALVRLGRLADDDHVVVDGTTGAVLTWSAPDGTLRPLVSDVSALALTLWALRRTAPPETGAGTAPA